MKWKHLVLAVLLAVPVFAQDPDFEVDVLKVNDEVQTDVVDPIVGPVVVDGVTVQDHHARHEDGGADEVDVTGLSGVLADPQTGPFIEYGTGTQSETGDVDFDTDGTINLEANGTTGTRNLDLDEADTGDAQLNNTSGTGAVSWLKSGANDVQLSAIGGTTSEIVQQNQVTDSGNVRWNVVVSDDSGVTTTQLSAEMSGFQIITDDTKPTCASGVRGRIWREEGGAGVDDTFEICDKDDGDAYAWRNLTNEDVALHASTHEDGGADEIDVTGLSGLLADPQTPASHASSHENGGGDEIDVGGLSGQLADDQPALAHDIEGAKHTASGLTAGEVLRATGATTFAFQPLVAGDLPAHASTHENGGTDEVDVAGLSGLLADDQNPTAHASDHENGGGDEIDVAGLSGLLADDQNPTTHALAGAEHSSDTSANLRSKLSDEIGTGPAMFGLAPTMEDGLSCTGSQVVRRNAGDTAFECATAGGGSSPLTTKGDIYVYDTGDQRLPVGADGSQLFADSSEATGLKWNAPSGVVADPAATVDRSWDFLNVENWYDSGSHINLDGWSFDIDDADLDFNFLASAEDNHPGVVQIESTANTQILGISRPQTFARFDQWIDVTFIVKFSAIGALGDIGLIQIASSPGVGSDSQDQASFRFSGPTGDIESVTADGSSFTRKDTTINMAMDTWYTFRIVRDGTDWEFYIDGTLRTTHDSGDDPPTASDHSNLGVLVSTGIGTGQQLNLDYVRERLSTNRSSGGGAGGAGGQTDTVVGQDSIENVGDNVDADMQLVGDVASPGNDKLYGTNGSGTRGWYDQPSGGGSFAPALFQARKTDGGTISTTEATVDFNTVDFEDTGFSESAGEVTIGAALDGKRIVISATVNGDANAGNRTQLELWIEKDTVDQLHSAQYASRNVTQNQGAVHIGPFYDTASTGDVYRIRVDRTGSAVDFDTAGCIFTIQQIED